MLICERCGEIIDQKDGIVFRHDFHTNRFGEIVHEETYEECPVCGGWTTEAKQCKICGEWKTEDSFAGNVCDCCVKKGATLDNLIEYIIDRDCVKEVFESLFSEGDMIDLIKDKLRGNDKEIVEVATNDKEDFSEWLEKKEEEDEQ